MFRFVSCLRDSRRSCVGVAREADLICVEERRGEERGGEDDLR